MQMAIPQTIPAPRPVIGIPTQTLQSLGGVSAAIPPSWVMSQRYIVTLEAAGALPWMVPLVDDTTIRGIYEQLDGVFLPGGADIDPVSYGTDPHPLCDRTDRERDRVEMLLARWAIADHKPVLGVCRGMQIINVAAGGSLFQDLAEQRPKSIKHDYFPYGGAAHTRDYLAHEVQIADGSRIASVFGAGALPVNSMHHQGVKELGEGLTATAHATDGLIEALEGNETSYLVAVQWHPEALTDGDVRARRLFHEFAAAARDYRNVPMSSGSFRRNRGTRAPSAG
ncbi:MAG: gamma-glutamyl-gamma-aminobutyrate hydrolase family protein [Gemmatimonadaceae bacterium]|nr:gamma-glutamyl-gamma-aminobutyrate hydrolase family protein [Gemmatimonadaceae bacterium]